MSECVLSRDYCSTLQVCLHVPSDPYTSFNLVFNLLKFFPHYTAPQCPAPAAGAAWLLKSKRCDGTCLPCCEWLRLTLHPGCQSIHPQYALLLLNQLHTPTSRRGPSYYSTHSCLLSWLCNGETSSLLQKLHILHHRLKTHRLRLWPIKKQIKIKNYPFPILFLNVTLENV